MTFAQVKSDPYAKGLRIPKSDGPLWHPRVWILLVDVNKRNGYTDAEIIRIANASLPKRYQRTSCVEVMR